MAMEEDQQFSSLWSQARGIEVVEEKKKVCSYAKEFSKWVDQLLSEEIQYSNVSINQAKIQLVDKFFEWYRYVPRSHKLRMGSRGHTCIFQVFENGYQRLKVIELTITPPLLFLPTNQTVLLPPPPRIAGIFLGEDLDEGEKRKPEEDE